MYFYASADDISATRDVEEMSCPSAHTWCDAGLGCRGYVTLAGRIAQGPRQAGLAVDAVFDGAAAVEAAGRTANDVIVLDRDLPRLHGDEVCRTLAGSGPRIPCSPPPPR